MKHPLENYRIIANHNFIAQMEDKFYTDYYHELNSGTYVDIDRDNNRMRVTGVDIYGNDFSEFISFTFYFLSEYEKLERESRSEIDKIILAILDETKQQVFIKGIIAELQDLQNAIKEISIKPEYDDCRKLLLRDSVRFSEVLKAIYFQNNQKEFISEKKSFKKLQWLGNTNILTTLFYDLINGVKSTNTPKLIDATPKEIELFIINNFVDKDGKEFDLKSTINTNLKHSKQSTKRALDGDGIDLNSYYKLE